MKGIILAGGSGTRLYPLTKSISKQLIPIYDKPMIYYPLSNLLEANIRDILIISTPKDLPLFYDLLGDGSHLGINIEYAKQYEPNGLAEAFIIGEDFIGDDNVCLILGDNLFYGNNINSLMKNAINITKHKQSVVFGYYVDNPSRYGVIEFDNNKVVKSIVEKPEYPKSNYAVVGLYFYTNDVIKITKTITPSHRNELEITDINQIYLKKNKLQVEMIDRGNAWLDTGTHESLLEASKFVEIIEKRQGLKIGCIEEIAYNMGYINKNQFKKLANNLSKSQYGQYLLKRI